MSYVQILDHLEQQEQQEDLYKFRAITGHQGPLSPQDENYKGSKYNVMVEWETGEITDEPLSLIAADDPVTCAEYAKKHDLLHFDGWKRLKHIAKDLRYTLMYLGVPVRSKSYMFGDNKSVVDSASIPTSTLSKKSTLASYHRVREAIAAGYLQFNWKDGKSNPADILSKHWEFANIWPLLKPLLFWKGDTDDLNAKTKGSDRIPTTKSLV